jgi:GT2 family glycosyltransferase
VRRLTASLLNINQSGLSIDVLDKLARLSADGWAIQLVMVDNGSRDNDVRRLSDWFMANKGRFEEVLFIAAGRNLGCGGGRNVAFKLASGDKILILDNDLILPDDAVWLEKLWQRMEDHPEVGLLAPMLVFAGYSGIVQAAGIGLTDRGRVGYLGRAEPVASVQASPIEVVAAPAACWLVRREAQQAVGLFSDEFYPVQYEDVDFCVRLGLAGWTIVCDRSVTVRHIENVTTQNLENYGFSRLTVRQWMQFKEKWVDVLPQIATISEEDIYWGPIPRL